MRMYVIKKKKATFEHPKLILCLLSFRLNISQTTQKLQNFYE